MNQSGRSPFDSVWAFFLVGFMTLHLREYNRMLI
jgi:hypothetical protein